MKARKALADLIRTFDAYAGQGRLDMWIRFAADFAVECGIELARRGLAWVVQERPALVGAFDVWLEKKTGRRRKRG